MSQERKECRKNWEGCVEKTFSHQTQITFHPRGRCLGKPQKDGKDDNVLYHCIHAIIKIFINKILLIQNQTL